MGAPVNYSHLTPDNIRVGRKYHVTLEEMATLTGEVFESQLGNLSGNWESTYNTVLANSAEWNLSGGSTFDASYMSGKIDANISNINYLSGQITGKLDSSIYQSASGNWESTYSTVLANSAMWALSGGSGLDEKVKAYLSGTAGYLVDTISYAGNITGYIDGNTLKLDVTETSGSLISGIWTNADDAEILYTPPSGTYTPTSQTISGHLQGIANWMALH